MNPQQDKFQVTCIIFVESFHHFVEINTDAGDDLVSDS